MPINEKRSLPRKGNGFIIGKNEQNDYWVLEKMDRGGYPGEVWWDPEFFSKELPAGFLEECDAGEVYEKFIIQSWRLKGLLIGLFTPDLWEYSFVHTWGRPDSVSETEFTEERKIFRKSINFKRAGFNELKKEISAELADILIYCLMLADRYDLDIIDIMKKKLSMNEKKYPVDRARGNARKYNEF